MILLSELKHNVFPDLCLFYFASVHCEFFQAEREVQPHFSRKYSCMKAFGRPWQVPSFLFINHWVFGATTSFGSINFNKIPSTKQPHSMMELPPSTVVASVFLEMQCSFAAMHTAQMCFCIPQATQFVASAKKKLLPRHSPIQLSLCKLLYCWTMHSDTVCS